MPAPSLTFDGISSAQSNCGCLPPDTEGDVGPNHFIASVNSSIKIFDKSGSALNGTNGTTYNSFFSPLGNSTPCGNGLNDGDGFVFYDQIAGRWVVSDFAFPDNQSVNYQCIGVSKTSDPVSGGWWLYALQIDSSHPTWLGDYPKFGLWPDAYYLSVNLFDENSDFQGVRVFALPRAAMINGTGAPNSGAIGFTITPATLGDTYSLVPATFRTGTAPAGGTPEYFLAIDSPGAAGTVQTKVYTWRFHADFGTPANSTFGLGATHGPNGSTTVNGFVDAFSNTSTLLVPQTGTIAKLDTLGDKIMTPLVYQNLGGTESLWAAHTVNNNLNGTGPTAIRWYQFNVTGGVIPATPAQQQTFNNGADGLWRFMPSIAVDEQGNMVINYSVSSSSTNPAIKYAGRLAGDTANTLGQGEGLLIQGAGHQTDLSGRWGDYSMISIDPADNLTFWLTNEYYSSNSAANWKTRIGKFKFGDPTPTPTPTPSPTPTPTPTPGTSVVLTALGTPACENFDTLANSGGTSSTTPAGWTFSESDTNANTTYSVGTGSATGGDTYSFGATGSTDRAFGGLQSGSLVPTIGAAFTNNTGQTIASVLISYTGEQWRLGALSRTDRLDFQISTDASSLTTGTWMDVNALDFTAPVQTGSTGALNGNVAPNRTSISSTITGLSIPNGATFWIRWNDLNATGADDGLAIDDFCLTANGSAQAPSITNGPPPSPVIVGSVYNFSFTATGNPSPMFSLMGTLPPGLGLSSAGVLSGTATSGGTGIFSDITVTATNGVPPDATETFTLTIATRANNYLTGFGLSGDDAAFTFDYDGDGISNLAEYGLGLDPTAAALGGLPVVILKDYSGTMYLSMTFHRSSLATDLSYTVQSSGDLIIWTDLASSTGGGSTMGMGFVAETGSSPNFTVEVRDTTAFDPNSPTKRFMRLKISTP
jgi:hypothetical protein